MNPVEKRAGVHSVKPPRARLRQRDEKKKSEKSGAGARFQREESFLLRPGRDHPPGNPNPIQSPPKQVARSFSQLKPEFHFLRLFSGASA
jgi:hypothetical protein